MSQPLKIDDVAGLLVEELTTVCGKRLGGEATSAPTDAPNAPGWALSIPVSGPAEGHLMVWFDRASAAACARAIAKSEEAPSDEAIASLMASLTHDATDAVVVRPGCAELVFGEPTISQSPAPAGARAYYIAVPNVASCLLAVGVLRPQPAQAGDSRLGAVLDVDLPLTVRFGRTVMPLHAVAELGPGSVIDMGRSPDDPVDLLVGERLIARGEVVVVGGNYGVRITYLAGGRDIAESEREMRTA